jgi:penicillin V acylase-like amidase (Ntn superfamily)
MFPGKEPIMKITISSRRGFKAGLFLVICLLVGNTRGTACSTFILRDGPNVYFGKNFDHYSSLGLLVVNKRDLAKTALLLPPERPISWISRFGSLTFNQVGREFPMGGMNEKGLVVELMGLEGTRYPKPDERPALMELQWIQYQLDNWSTVDEVLACQSRIRISQSMSPLHFLVCDQSGRAAVIEFLEGQCVVHTGSDLIVEALTNDPYETCLELLRAYPQLDWDKKADHTTYRSKDRFLKIARRLEDFRTEHPGPAKDYAFDILSSLSVERVRGQCTAWSIVYDLANMDVSFKTFENRRVRSVRMRNFDFSSETPSLALDLARDLAGDVSGFFAECTTAVNRRLVEKIFKTYAGVGFVRNISPLQIQFLAAYPDTLKRVQKKKTN